MWEPKEVKVRNKWAGLQTVWNRQVSNPVIWQRSQQVMHWSWCQAWKESKGCPFSSVWVQSEAKWYASQVGIRPRVQQNNPLTHRSWCSCSRLAKQAQGTRWQLGQVCPQATYEDCETPCSAVMCLLNQEWWRQGTCLVFWLQPVACSVLRNCWGIDHCWCSIKTPS